MASIVYSAFRLAYESLPTLPTFQNVYETAVSNLPSKDEVIRTFHQVVSSISGIVKVSLVCFGAHYFAKRKPIFFVGAFIAGIAFDETIKTTIDKVELVARSYKFSFFYFGMYTLPVTLDYLSIGYAAKLGSYLSLQCRGKLGGT